MSINHQEKRDKTFSEVVDRIVPEDELLLSAKGCHVEVVAAVVVRVGPLHLVVSRQTKLESFLTSYIFFSLLIEFMEAFDSKLIDL